MRALRTLQGSWVLCLAVLALGIWALVQSLPDLSESRASASWRPTGVRISGRWSPSQVGTPSSFESNSEALGENFGFAALGDDEQASAGGPPLLPVPDLLPEIKPKKGSSSVRRSIQKYRVSDGDRYWTIAARFLGRGERWREIQALNPNVPPNRLREGTILRVPADMGTVVKNRAQTAITRAGNDPPANPRLLRPLKHRVRRGESLSEIASRYYIDGDWRRIFDANRERVKHPNRVEKGTMLTIPRVPGKEKRS